MKYVIIDDNEAFAESLSLHFIDLNIESEAYCNLGKGLKSFTERFDGAKNGSNKGKKININNNDVIFININLKAKENTRLDQAGIKLLIWLRIKGVMNHCVLYSFEKLHDLLNRKPEHLIATSKGTTFVQLPSDFANIEEILKRKKDKNSFLADERNVKEVLKPAFNIEEIRHQEANWWGVKALYDAHRMRTLKGIKSDYPDHVQSKLDNLNNALAAFLYGTESITMLDLLNEARVRQENREKENKKDLEKRESKIENINLEIELYNEAINRIEQRIKNRDMRLQAKNHWQALYDNNQSAAANEKKKKLELENRRDQQDLDELNQERAALEKEREDFEQGIDQESQNDIVDDELINEANQIGFNEYDYDRNQRILVVDDLAEKVWAETYNTVFGNRVEMDSISPENLNQDYPVAIKTLKNNLNNYLQNKINPLNLTCIFLDLRLHQDDNKNRPVEEYTGCILLKEIKKEYPYIPIVITTASNKIWTYFETQNLGADAYWNKEGIDNFFSAQESAENYDRLRELVYSFSKQEYKSLKSLGSLFETIKKTEERFWWEEMKWEKPSDGIIKHRGDLKQVITNTKVDKDRIVELLNQAIQLYSQFLRGRLIHKQLDETNSDIFFSSVIIQFGRIIELIHPYGDYCEIPYGIVIKRRKDHTGKELYDKRNSFAHIGKYDEGELIYFFHIFVLCFSHYLTQHKFSSIGKIEDLLSSYFYKYFNKY